MLDIGIPTCKWFFSAELSFCQGLNQDRHGILRTIVYISLKYGFVSYMSSKKITAYLLCVVSYDGSNDRVICNYSTFRMLILCDNPNLLKECRDKQQLLIKEEELFETDLKHTLRIYRGNRKVKVSMFRDCCYEGVTLGLDFKPYTAFE